MFSIRMVTNFLVSAALGLGLVLGAVKEARVLAQRAVSEARVAVVQSLDTFGSAMAEVALQLQWGLRAEAGSDGVAGGEANAEGQAAASAEGRAPDAEDQSGVGAGPQPDSDRPGRFFSPWDWVSHAFPALQLTMESDAAADSRLTGENGATADLRLNSITKFWLSSGE